MNDTERDFERAKGQVVLLRRQLKAAESEFLRAQLALIEDRMKQKYSVKKA